LAEIKFVCGYLSYRDMLAPFTEAEIGRLFMAMLDYARNGEIPNFSGNERFIWPTLQRQIQADKEVYADTCERNKRNGRKGGRPKTQISDTQGFPEEPKKANEKEKEREKEKEKEKEKENENEHEKEKEKEKEKEIEKEKENEKENENEKEKECVVVLADKPPTTTTLPTREEVKRYCQEQGYPIDWDYFYDYYTGNGWKTGKNPISDWKAVVRNWARKEKNHERTDKNQFSEFGPIGIVL